MLNRCFYLEHNRTGFDINVVIWRLYPFGDCSVAAGARVPAQTLLRADMSSEGAAVGFG